MIKNMKIRHTIFYSWKSDEPNNTGNIKSSIRKAMDEVEGKIIDINIILDEATRDESGSPNIPKTILNKISEADIFICDVSIINLNQTCEIRKTPNPNVLIELGYAIATLGWGRIILLFDKSVGKIEDSLPFDIKTQRITSFELTKDGKNKLNKTIELAISQIIIKSPLKSKDIIQETDEQRKRRIDISNLNWILSTIHIPTFDHFLEEIPFKVFSLIDFFKYGFDSILRSNLFHIYDQNLLNRILKLKDSWDKSLSYKHALYYDHSSSEGYFVYSFKNYVFKEQAQETYRNLDLIKEDLKQNFKDLIQFIRGNYLEVDIEVQSDEAWQNYEQKAATKNLLIEYLDNYNKK